MSEPVNQIRPPRAAGAPAAGVFGVRLASELFAPALPVAEGCPTLEQFEARMCSDTAPALARAE